MRPGLRFLHVGSGTGYFASIVGVMLQGTGSNHGVELRDELVTFARGATARYAEKLGVAMPTQFIRGNALALDDAATHGTYDRVYVGAGCGDERTKGYMVGLLKVNGILVGPFENELLKITRLTATNFLSEPLISVKFSPLVLLPPPPAAERERRPNERRRAPARLTFQLDVWSPKSHAYYPDDFRDIAFFLMANQDLPVCVWHEVLSFMRHDWFVVPDEGSGWLKKKKKKKKRAPASGFCTVS